MKKGGLPMTNLLRMRMMAKGAIDCVLITLCYFMAFALLYDLDVPPFAYLFMMKTVAVVISIRFTTLWLFSRYQPAWRYVSLHDLSQIMGATVASTFFIAGVFHFWSPGSAPRTILVIDALLNVLLLLGMRVFFRVSFPVYHRVLRTYGEHDKKPERRRVLIIGADGMGEQVAREIGQVPYKWDFVGFVDDNRARHGGRIHGRRVHGPISSLPIVLETLAVDEVLVALSNLSGQEVSRIVSLCENSSAHLSIVPPIDNIMKNGGPEIRDIKPEDLLEREPITLDSKPVEEFLTGQVVLVTGAGGSIGSEICRQVAAMKPKQLIMLGRGENSIFEALYDLKAKLTQPDGSLLLDPIPVIASVEDEVRMRAVFDTYRPTVVFHAAAHKHVPLMEAHPCEAIQNNVLGTRNVINLSDEFKVKKFVLISTDKAVNPTSVMGASKRIAEMTMQAKAAHSETVFVAVRFGNVLGSRGSVVPTMKKQIERGGPVTVTHPDMTRFFMIIPEAVLLVLQAAAIGNNGEVFVLDMGSPVRIMDLARNLIRLSGKIPDKDIEIKIVGMRPGEKLHEELMTAEEGVNATQYSRISVTKGQVGQLSRAELSQILRDFETAVLTSDSIHVRRLLWRAIPTYYPDEKYRKILLADPPPRPAPASPNGTAPQRPADYNRPFSSHPYRDDKDLSHNGNGRGGDAVMTQVVDLDEERDEDDE